MTIIFADDQETDLLELRFEAMVRRPPAAGTPIADKSVSFGETFLASAKRENVTFAAIQFTAQALDEEGVDQLDPNFNPYTYIKEQFSDEEFEEFRDEFSRGLFDAAATGEQVELRKVQLRKEREVLRLVEQGSGTAMFLGAIFGALTDPISYTPLGFVNRLRTGSRIVKGVVAGFVAGGVPEVGLQAIQDYRTLTESFLNIGIGGVFGGGIGAFSRMLNPKHPGFPSKEHRLFDVESGEAIGHTKFEDEPIGIVTPDGGPAGKLDHVTYEGTVGAARPEDLQVGFTKMRGVFTKIPGLNKFFEWATKVTPVGRGGASISQRWRIEFQKLVDPGGMMFTNSKYGIGIQKSAESLKHERLSQTRDRLFSFIEFELKRLNKELAGTGGKSFSIGGFPDQDFMKIIKEHLREGGMDATALRGFQDKYGKAAFDGKINAVAKNITKEIHRANKFMENDLIKQGFLQNKPLIEQLSKEIDQLKQQLAKEAEGAKAAALKSKAREKGSDARDEAVQRAAFKTEIESRLSDAELALQKQNLLPEPKGEAFGHAQMWDRQTFMENPGGATDFIRSILLDQPDARFLSDFGLTEAQFGKLGVDEVKVGGETLSVADGKELKRNILEEWTQGEDALRVNRAQDKLIEAQQAERDANVDLKAAEHEAGLLAKDAGKNRTAGIKLARDKINIRVNAMRLATEHARREAQAAKSDLDKLVAQGKASRIDAAPEFHPTIKGVKGKLTKANSTLKDLKKQLGALPKKAPKKAAKAAEPNKELPTLRENLRQSNARLQAINSQPKGTKGLGQPRAAVSKLIKNIGDRIKRLESADRIAAKAAKGGPDLPALREALGVKVAAVEKDLVALKQSGKPVKGAAKRPTPQAVAKAQQRATTANTEVRKANADFKLAVRRQKKIEDAAADLEARRKGTKDRQSELAKAKTLKKAQAKVASTGRKIKKLEKFIKFRVNKAKNDRAPGLEGVVKDIVASIRKNNFLPHGILDQIVPEGGRLKARRLIMTREQQIAGENARFLRSDLTNILDSQYDQLASHLAFREALGIDTLGGRFDTWEQYLEFIQEDFENLIKVAKKEGRQGDVKKIRKQMEQTEKDANGLKSRILGTEHTHDPDAWAPWLSQKVRDANYIRFGAGFLLPSLTDVAAISLVNGGFGKLLLNHLGEAMRLMKKLHVENPSEFRAMLYATEQGPFAMRLQRLADAEQRAQRLGIGQRGSTKDTVTTAIDAGSQRVKALVGKFSGLNYWNRAFKIMTGINYAQKIHDLVPRYGKLKQKDIDDLVAVGIGKFEAKRMATFLEKHGIKDAQGRTDPNFEAWGNTVDALAAQRDFRMAIRRAQDRAIFTPGLGDTPLLMSGPFAKTWLQFQTFAFAFQNRFMVPISQKMVNGHQANAMNAYAHLVWSAAIVVIGKDLLRGKPIEEIEDRFFDPDKWPDTARDMLDRSSYFSFFSPYIDSLVKFSGPLQENLLGEVVLGPGSRYSALNAWQGALGAGFGLGRDINGAFASLLAGDDVDKVITKAARLAPFNFFWKIMHSTSERFE